MLAPSVLLEAAVAKFRDVAALVMLLSNDPDNIYLYNDQAPPSRSAEEAASQMASPGMMVAFQGSVIVPRGGINTWQHRFAAYLRTEGVHALSPTLGGYYDLWHAFVEGVPDGCANRLIDEPIHPDCDPIGEDVSFVRALDDGGTEHWTIVFSLNEIGG